ncbi:intracellular septation protein A [Nocardia sp. GAS34]|uniref:VC0807 family protein n=1 Tax=unclassified Nocardia TaxID=2637762 RepID=UPI003D21E434
MAFADAQNGLGTTQSEPSRAEAPIQVPQASTAAPGVDRKALARQLLRDVGVPMAAYYGLHAAGASNLVALGAGTVLSGMFLVAEIVRKRQLDPFAAVILASFALGLALTFTSGDARFVVAKDSFTTALIGAAFLLSTAIGRPLIYVSAQRGMSAEAAAAFRERYRTNPRMRRTLATLSVVWGAGLCAEAALRVVLVYHLSIPTMVWLSNVMMVTTFGVLIAVTLAVVRRARARAEAAEV